MEKTEEKKKLVTVTWDAEDDLYLVECHYGPIVRGMTLTIAELEELGDEVTRTLAEVSA